MAGKYLVAHSRSPQYKTLLKTLFKAALAPLPVQVRRAVQVALQGFHAPHCSIAAIACSHVTGELAATGDMIVSCTNPL